MERCNEHIHLLDNEIRRNNEKVTAYVQDVETLTMQDEFDNLEAVSTAATWDNCETSDSVSECTSDESSLFPVEEDLQLPITCKEGGPVTRIGDIFANNAQ